MTDETLQESIKTRPSSYPDSSHSAQGSFGLHAQSLAFAPLPPHSTQATTHILSPEYSVAAALNPIQPSSTAATIQIWMSAQSRIAPLRNDILANRLNIKRQRHQCYQLEHRLEGEMDAFIALVNSITTQDSYKQLQDSLNQHLSIIKALRYGVKILRETTAANEDTLSSQEYQLSRLEEEIYHEIDRSLQNDNFQPLSCFRSASDYTLQPSHTEVDKNPDLLEKLYTRMGEMRICMERLSNFEYDLRQEMDERDMIRAGSQIEISDDLQFFEEARERRAQIQKDLDEAEADVDNLRHQCRTEGIAFKEPQLPNVFYHSGTESFTAPSYRVPSYHERPIPPSGIIGAFFGAQERVKRWIRDPQPDTAEPESCSRSDTQSRSVPLNSDLDFGPHTRLEGH